MNLPFKISGVLFVAILSLFVLSCQSPKIKPSQTMKFMYEIYEGDELALEWNFENASIVRIEGIEGSFFPKGSVLVKPESSKQYKFKVFKGFKDSISYLINVDVLAGYKETGEIRTGDIVLHEQFVQPSVNESEYLNGRINEDMSDGTNEMRIVKVKAEPGAKAAYADILLLDKYGNYITGFGNKSNRIIWNATNLCGGITANYSNLEFKELKYSNVTERLDLAILIDNSMFSYYSNLPKSIHASLSGLKTNDNVLLAGFSESYNQINRLLPAEQAVLGFSENFVIQPKHGFSASNDAMITAINQLSGGTSSNKALIVITHTNDNASVLTTSEDVINAAISGNISIFVIGIGDAIAGYEYKQLCNATGGNYYLLLPDETDKLQGIISEIIFCYRNCYRVTIPFQNFNRNCNIRSTTLQYVDSRHDLSETISYTADTNLKSKKIVYACGFPVQSISISPEYLLNLDRIANSLQKIKDEKIVITGFSYSDGSQQNSRRIAQQRADTVKYYLSSKGVPTAKMLTKSNTNDNPLFTSSADTNLINLNRRVEISFTEIMKQFYEIIVDNAESEDVARNLSIEWEKRGYKAYYLRSYGQSPISYQVRLWGYNSKTEADKTVAIIKSKYKKNPVIE